MRLEQLLLKKEELPILHETCFIVPIYFRLLDEDIKINPEIANQVFPQAAKEWYDELKEYIETVENEKTKEWYESVFLTHELKIKKEYGRQIVDPPGFWEDTVITGDNGFATGLSINRNVGGSLGLPWENHTDQIIYPPLVNFSPEKLKVYATLSFPNVKSVYAPTYSQHNVDHYPGALFLRNWAILYLNEAMKSVGKELLKPKIDI